MSNCRVCSSETKPFIDFGSIPLGNAFLKGEDFEREKRFDLALAFCDSCKLVQQVSPPPTRDLESDYQNYSYVPYGNTLGEHYKDLARAISLMPEVNKDSFVVDIGSNDGLLLRHLQEMAGCSTLGVEPAVRISKMAQESGVPTINAFFTEDVAREIRMAGMPTLATCTQVLQHIPDPVKFLLTAFDMLRDDGTLIVEGRYFTDTVKKRTYDTVYHEMISFFTLHSLKSLLERVGFTVYRAERNEIYGGSLRVYASKRKIAEEESVEKILRDERFYGLTMFPSYTSFASDVFLLRDELSGVVKKLKEQGKSIAAYGAPSTSATLLNFCEIGRESINYVVDDSPLKQGLFTPGTRIPIVPQGHLQDHHPDYILLLAWRLKAEILSKLEPLRAQGTKVIIPLPQVEVI